VGYKADSTECHANVGDMHGYVLHVGHEMDDLRVASHVDTLLLVSYHVLDIYLYLNKGNNPYCYI